MAETVLIAQMAELLSNELFGVFGWTRAQGPINHNWKCETAVHELDTHPSDVIFWYDDPYGPDRVYWNFDLKSYAVGTIQKARLAGAISDLAKSTECANNSSDWQTLYYDGDESNWRCDGLLFVYNHDGEYTGDFDAVIKDVHLKNFVMAPKRRMAIVGPAEIRRLHSVVTDIKSLTFGGQMSRDFEFWYPHLVRPKRRDQTKSAATIEMLLGPWIVARDGNKFFIWYNEKGDSEDEFVYLLDSFFRYQMINKDGTIDVRMVNASGEAILKFNAAKARVRSDFHGLADALLDKVSCNTVPSVTRVFSTIELGME